MLHGQVVEADTLWRVLNAVLAVLVMERKWILVEATEELVRKHTQKHSSVIAQIQSVKERYCSGLRDGYLILGQVVGKLAR